MSPHQAKYCQTVDRLRRRYIDPTAHPMKKDGPEKFKRLDNAAWRRCKAQQAAPRILSALERLAHPMADDADLDNAQWILMKLDGCNPVK